MLATAKDGVDESRASFGSALKVFRCSEGDWSWVDGFVMPTVVELVVTPHESSGKSMSLPSSARIEVITPSKALRWCRSSSRARRISFSS